MAIAELFNTFPPPNNNNLYNTPRNRSKHSSGGKKVRKKCLKHQKVLKNKKNLRSGQIIVRNVNTREYISSVPGNISNTMKAG